MIDVGVVVIVVFAIVAGVVVYLVRAHTRASCDARTAEAEARKWEAMARMVDRQDRS